MGSNLSITREELKKRIDASNFIQNNGRVLRAINILRCKYNKLKDIEYALDIPHDEIVDCVNYLHECEYIKLRHTISKQDTCLADSDFEEIEAKLSADGIKLIAGKKTDECIDI